MRQLQRSLALMACLLAIGISLFAQTRISVHGTIKGENGQALELANILVKGTKHGAQTNEKGEFALNVPSDAVLIINYTGYLVSEVPVNNQSSLNITLNPIQNNLEEAVVIAYGTAKRSTYTGSIAQITAKDIEKRPISNALNALVGAAPGIQTTVSGGAPGSAPAIRLRGFGSYSASSSPLYVVDGIPYDAGSAQINADDIETMSVLKDASTTALYGSRGANGVIMITTKKGKRNSNHMSFKVTGGIVRRGLPEYERVDAFQYYPLMWEAYRNSLVYGAAKLSLENASQIASGLLPRFTSGANSGKQNFNGAAYSDISQLLGYNPFDIASTTIVDVNGQINPNAKLLYGNDLDWASASTKGGRSRQNYELSYNGGNDKSDYYSSLGYTEEKGYMTNSGLRRFNGRLNVNTQPTTWFKTGLNIAGSATRTQNIPTSGIVNPFYFSRYIGPIYPVFAHQLNSGELILDATGNPVYDYGNMTEYGLPTRPYNAGRHSILENLLNSNVTNSNLLSGRAYADIIFMPGLKATVNIGADRQNNNTKTYENTLVGDGAPAGRASQTATNTTSYTFNQLLTYQKKFGRHNLDVLAGHENYDYTYNYLYGFKQGQIVEGIIEFPNFSTINSLSSYKDRATIESYLSRLNYDFDGKYILSASWRRDGNSRFHPDFRWSNFWSLGGAWSISKESFFKADWVNDLKIRASYGKVGNDGGIGLYPYQALYNLGRNNATEPGFVQGTLANDSLTWESSNSLEIGTDFSLFKGRISGTIAYFNRESSGLIFSVPQPLSNGGTSSGSFSINKNIGNLYNRGMEIQLTGILVRNKDFNYSMTVNVTKFNNKITKMPDNPSEIIDGTKKLSVGHSIYDFWLRHFYGVDPDNGDALYTAQTYNAANSKIIQNANGSQDTVTNAISNAKYFYTGTSSIPKLYGSIVNNFSYKNFDLSITVLYQIGGKVYDGVYASLMNSGTYGSALSTDILRRWQKPGDITDVPRMDNARTSDFGGGSDRWLINASYLSINNANLAYRLPAHLLSPFGISSARVYVAGENIATFSKRKGMNVNGAFSGTTSDSYNYSRIISFGLNVNF